MLERMLDIAEEVDAKVVLVIPASNIGDFAPFKSAHKAGLTAEDASRWQTLYGQALKLTRQRRLEEALAVLAEAQSIDNRRADLYFAKGQLLLALKRYPEAAKAFDVAKQEDICPLRAINELVQVIRMVGQSRGAIMVDFADLVAQHCDNQIPNHQMFHDHVHPTMAANRLLAMEILDRMAAEGLLTFDPGWDAEAMRRITSKLESSIDRPLYASQLVALTSLMIKLGQTGMARVQALAAFELSGRAVDTGIAVSQLANATENAGLGGERHAPGSRKPARLGTSAVASWGWCWWPISRSMRRWSRWTRPSGSILTWPKRTISPGYCGLRKDCCPKPSSISCRRSVWAPSRRRRMITWP